MVLNKIIGGLAHTTPYLASYRLVDYRHSDPTAKLVEGFCKPSDEAYGLHHILMNGGCEFTIKDIIPNPASSKSSLVLEHRNQISITVEIQGLEVDGSLKGSQKHVQILMSFDRQPNRQPIILIQEPSKTNVKPILSKADLIEQLDTVTKELTDLYIDKSLGKSKLKKCRTERKILLAKLEKLRKEKLSVPELEKRLEVVKRDIEAFKTTLSEAYKPIEQKLLRLAPINQRHKTKVAELLDVCKGCQKPIEELEAELEAIEGKILKSKRFEALESENRQKVETLRAELEGLLESKDPKYKDSEVKLRQILKTLNTIEESNLPANNWAEPLSEVETSLANVKAEFAKQNTFAGKAKIAAKREEDQLKAQAKAEQKAAEKEAEIRAEQAKAKAEAERQKQAKIDADNKAALAKNAEDALQKALTLRLQDLEKKISIIKTETESQAKTYKALQVMYATESKKDSHLESDIITLENKYKKLISKINIYKQNQARQKKSEAKAELEKAEEARKQAEAKAKLENQKVNEAKQKMARNAPKKSKIFIEGLPKELQELAQVIESNPGRYHIKSLAGDKFSSGYGQTTFRTIEQLVSSIGVGWIIVRGLTRLLLRTGQDPKRFVKSAGNYLKEDPTFKLWQLTGLARQVATYQSDSNKRGIVAQILSTNTLSHDGLERITTTIDTLRDYYRDLIQIYLGQLNKGLEKQDECRFLLQGLHVLNSYRSEGEDRFLTQADLDLITAGFSESELSELPAPLTSMVFLSMVLIQATVQMTDQYKTQRYGVLSSIVIHEVDPTLSKVKSKIGPEEFESSFYEHLVSVEGGMTCMRESLNSKNVARSVDVLVAIAIKIYKDLSSHSRLIKLANVLMRIRGVEKDTDTSPINDEINCLDLDPATKAKLIDITELLKLHFFSTIRNIQIKDDLADALSDKCFGLKVAHFGHDASTYGAKQLVTYSLAGLFPEDTDRQEFVYKIYLDSLTAQKKIYPEDKELDLLLRHLTAQQESREFMLHEAYGTLTPVALFIQNSLQFAKSITGLMGWAQDNMIDLEGESKKEKYRRFIVKFCECMDLDPKPKVDNGMELSSFPYLMMGKFIYNMLYSLNEKTLDSNEQKFMDMLGAFLEGLSMKVQSDVKSAGKTSETPKDLDADVKRLVEVGRACTKIPLKVIALDVAALNINRGLLLPEGQWEGE